MPDKGPNPRKRKLPDIPRRGYRINEWCTAFNTSRAKAYEMMKDGELRYVSLGGRRFIPNEAAAELLQPQARADG